MCDNSVFQLFSVQIKINGKKQKKNTFEKFEKKFLKMKKFKHFCNIFFFQKYKIHAHASKN